MRKDAIAQKQQKLKNDSEIQNNKTYANIVKTTIKETTPPAKPITNLTGKHHLKWVLLILEAHIASIGEGRPYNVILQEILKANNLDVTISSRDSQKFLDIYLNPKQKQKDMPLKNSSTNPAQAQMMKALTKKNFNLPKRRTKPLQKHKNDQTTEKMKKRRRKILQNLLQPLINKQPRQERLATPIPPNPKPSTSSGFQRTPPNQSSQEKRRPSVTSEFQWTAPTHHPKKNVDHLQSFTEAGMILRRSQTYSHRNGSKTNS